MRGGRFAENSARQNLSRIPIIKGRHLGMPEADDRDTIVFRRVDQDDPHGASSFASFTIPEAENAAEHYGPFA